MAFIGVVKPFREKVRNIFAFANEVALLSVFTFIYPYVTYWMDEDDFLFYRKFPFP